MDDLMNKIATLIEEHVKSEVEALLLLRTKEHDGPLQDIDEVDGFRVGDLVRYWRIDSDCEYLPIVKFHGSEAVYITHSGAAPYENVIDVAELRRKPVEVGDTVRVSGRSGEQFVVESYEYDDGEEWARCRSNLLSSDLIRSNRLIAIAD